MFALNWCGIWEPSLWLTRQMSDEQTYFRESILVTAHFFFGELLRQGNSIDTARASLSA